jgi:hypothetical protein
MSRAISDRLAVSDLMMVVADEAPRSRNLAVGAAQALIALASAVLIVLSIRYQLNAPAGDPDQTTGWIVTAFFVVICGLCVVFGGRNLQRLNLAAAITADENGVRVCVPRPPFPMAPFQVLSDRVVPWSDVDPTVTNGRNARLLVSPTDPASEIPTGQFEASLAEIDAGVRAAALEFNRPTTGVGIAETFEGSSRLTMLAAGLACVLLGGGAMVALNGGGVTIFFFIIVLGFGLLGIGLAPRKRATLDRRGLFVERGRKLDFIPAGALAQARKEYSRSLGGLFQSGTIDTSVDGKRVRTGFNRVLGLGFPVQDLFEAIYRL